MKRPECTDGICFLSAKWWRSSVRKYLFSQGRCCNTTLASVKLILGDLKRRDSVVYLRKCFQEVKQGRIIWSVDSGEDGDGGIWLAQTHLPPLTNNRRFWKAARLFFAQINLTFAKCFHRKALNKTNSSASLICSCLQSVLMHSLWRSPVWFIRFVPNVGRTSEHYCHPDFRRLKYVLGCSKRRLLLNETGFKGWLHAFGITGGLVFTDLWF